MAIDDTGGVFTGSDGDLDYDGLVYDFDEHFTQ